MVSDDKSVLGHSIKYQVDGRRQETETRNLPDHLVAQTKYMTMIQAKGLQQIGYLLEHLESWEMAQKFKFCAYPRKSVAYLQTVNLKQQESLI